MIIIQTQAILKVVFKSGTDVTANSTRVNKIYH